MICSKENCTGCFACYNACPKNAIIMEEDEHGFIYPKINSDLCVNCDICKKVCPSLNDIVFQEPIRCYATHSKDKKTRETTTSGGMASVMSEYIINNNGVVYGAVFTKERSVKHIRIDNLSDIEKAKGSKYVHSYINDCYKNILNDLINNKKVLFVGTPCQVAGLKKFLRKDYDDLYCIDIICHGVPSQKYLKDELLTIKEDITKLSFRSKDGFRIKAFHNDKILLDTPMEESIYYTGFMESTFYRENCYSCQYARKERISDITIGDFWGLDKSSKLFENRDDGVSVVLINNKKGENLFEECKEKLIYEERDVNEAVAGNTQLREPSKKKKDYEIFYKKYITKGFKEAFYKSNRKLIIKRKIKNILKKNKTLYNFCKKVIRREQ